MTTPDQRKHSQRFYKLQPTSEPRFSRGVTFRACQQDRLSVRLTVAQSGLVARTSVGRSPVNSPAGRRRRLRANDTYALTKTCTRSPPIAASLHAVAASPRLEKEVRSGWLRDRH